jgi:hypothetical protein
MAAASVSAEHSQPQQGGAGGDTAMRNSSSTAASSAASRSEAEGVSLERWTVYLLLSAQIMNNLAIRFGLPALIFFMQQEYRWNPTQLARVTGAFFPGCAP